MHLVRLLDGTGALLTARPAARTGATAAVLLAAAVALAGLHVRRPSTLCPLRELTGIPCPICGGTTAAVDLGRGDLLAALRASPLALLLAVGVVLLPYRERLPQLTTRTWVLVAITVAVASETYQLARFHLL